MGAGDSEFPEVCRGFKIVVKASGAAQEDGKWDDEPKRRAWPMAIR